jgi:hypothetical protein
MAFGKVLTSSIEIQVDLVVCEIVELWGCRVYMGLLAKGYKVY